MFIMLQELRKKLRIRFAVPCGVPLGIRYLYVLPNKGGWILLLILLAMLAFGINYQNNLVLILAVFLLCVIFTSVFYGFFNMNGVGIEIKKMNIAVHAGTTLPLPVFVSARTAPGQSRIVKGLRITAPGATALIAPDLATGSTVQLSFANEKRGLFRVPLLAVCSSWPLGIINTFSYIKPETEILIYPRPVSCEYLLDRLPGLVFGSRDSSSEKQGISEIPETRARIQSRDEISGVRPYRPGDPPGIIDWKRTARGQGLMVKDFSQDNSMDLYLNINSIRSGNYEDSISKLTWAVVDLARKEQRFGFNAFGIFEAPDTAGAHTGRILTRLSLLPEGRYHAGV